MANTFDRVEDGDDAGGAGFAIRDLLRFFMVDVIIIVVTKLMLGLGVFTTPDAYVLAVLGGKFVLFCYLIWLIREHRDAWSETGAATMGRWWGWLLALAAYVAGYPLLSMADRANQDLMVAVYAWFGWVYVPEVQDVMILIFDTIVSQPVRVVLVVFTILLGPFMEELAFRGMGMDAFRRSRGVVSSIVFSSVLFGLYHFSLSNILPLSLLGIFFAIARVVSGSLWCATMLHCLHNTFVLLLIAWKMGWFQLPSWAPF